MRKKWKVNSFSVNIIEKNNAFFQGLQIKVGESKAATIVKQVYTYISVVTLIKIWLSKPVVDCKFSKNVKTYI